MAKTPEGKVKHSIKAALKKAGAWYFMPVQTGYTQAGIPDVIACYRGYFIGIEAKAGKNTPTLAQRIQLDKIMDAGGVRLVINEDNLHELLNTLTAIDMSIELRTATAKANQV